MRPSAEGRARGRVVGEDALTAPGGGSACAPTSAEAVALSEKTRCQRPAADAGAAEIPRITHNSARRAIIAGTSSTAIEAISRRA
jgi:hypothetical protein